MNNTRFLARVYVLALGLIFLTACTQKGDRGFLEGTPCAPPCWQNITPGMSDEVAVLHVLARSDLILQDSVKRQVGSHPRPDPSLTRYSYRLKAGGQGYLKLRDGWVIGIWIEPGFGLVLQEVIDNFGLPESLYVTEGSSHFICYLASFFYPSQGIWVKASNCGQSGVEDQIVGNSALLLPETRVVDFTFFSPSTDLEPALTKLLHPHPETAQHIITYKHPWVGFGYYTMAP
jgi:hypothetical protein